MPLPLDTDIIENFKKGIRVGEPHSKFDEPVLGICLSGHGHWRVIACDGETDVVECCQCGEQKLATCNFDEEYQ